MTIEYTPNCNPVVLKQCYKIGMHAVNNGWFHTQILFCLKTCQWQLTVIITIEFEQKKFPSRKSFILCVIKTSAILRDYEYIPRRFVPRPEPRSLRKMAAVHRAGRIFYWIFACRICWSFFFWAKLLKSTITYEFVMFWKKTWRMLTMKNEMAPERLDSVEADNLSGMFLLYK